MVELVLADWLAIGGIVVTIIVVTSIVGAVIFAVQKRLSYKVNKIILDQQDRNAKRKHYHIVRLKARTEGIKKGIVFAREMLDKHMSEPTVENWEHLAGIVARHKQQVTADWNTIEHDLSRISELVKEQYLVDK